MFPLIQIKETKSRLSLKIGLNQIKVHKGDITSVAADAIVCPVNQTLDTTTGLAKIILNAAGKNIRKHQPLNPEPLGKVVVLPAGQLSAKYIFLSVVMSDKNLGKTKSYIAQAVDRTIRYAEFLRLKSIAFPLLGSAEHLHPYEPIAKEMIKNVQNYFKRKNSSVKAVLFSAYNTAAFEALKKEAKDLS